MYGKGLQRKEKLEKSTRRNRVVPSFVLRSHTYSPVPTVDLLCVSSGETTERTQAGLTCPDRDSGDDQRNTRQCVSGDRRG